MKLPNLSFFLFLNTKRLFHQNSSGEIPSQIKSTQHSQKVMCWPGTKTKHNDL